MGKAYHLLTTGRLKQVENYDYLVNKAYVNTNSIRFIYITATNIVIGSLSYDKNLDQIVFNPLRFEHDKWKKIMKEIQKVL